METPSIIVQTNAHNVSIPMNRLSMEILRKLTLLIHPELLLQLPVLLERL